MRSSERLIPTWIVRVIAIMLLCVSLFLVYIAMTNYKTIGVWWVLLVGLSGATTVFFSCAALKTGRAEWIMLDLILPS